MSRKPISSRVSCSWFASERSTCRIASRDSMVQPSTGFSSCLLMKHSSLKLASRFVSELPEIHVNELHERIVRSAVVPDDSLLATKRRQICKREVQELLDE